MLVHPFNGAVNVSVTSRIPIKNDICDVREPDHTAAAVWLASVLLGVLFVDCHSKVLAR